MGRDLHAEFALVRQTFAEASEVLGWSLERLCFDGPEEELTLTANAQPALLALSVAIGRLVEAESGVRPQIAAGHSLGEWSALVLVGALDLAQAVAAVRERGRLMQEAVAPGVGAMAALLGADLETVEQLCREASRSARLLPDAETDEIVVPANLNGGGQIVVAGHTAAVDRLEILARGRKVRAMRLKVSAPFHSPLMRPARERMASVLEGLTMRPLAAPVVSNVDGRPNASAERARELLAEQITAPVRWEDCLRAVAQHADVAVEVGPGKVLAGLARRVAPELACWPTGDLAGVRAAVREVGG
jgi:[acyl-carrier-protein] S-malonyltransferase